MSPQYSGKFKEHNILSFNQLNGTTGVNNVNMPQNCNNTMIPVTLNSNKNSNYLGGGNSFAIMSSDEYYDIYAMDTVSNVNTISYKVCNQQNNTDEVQYNNCHSIPQHGSPLPMIPHRKPNHKLLSQAPNVSLHKVNRFNDKFTEQSDSSVNQLVYIHNYPQNKQGGFYFLKTIGGIPHISINEYLSHPVGELILCDSIWLCIYPAVSGAYNTLRKQEGTQVYDNYKQDCLSRKRYGISYESYMNDIIEVLIESQPNLDVKDQDCNRKFSPTKGKTTQAEMRSPIQKSISQTLNKKFSKDTNYHNKEWGYISLHPTKFEFIGPDRPSIDPRNVDQYLHLAKKVKESGVPNYRQVRVPIKSDLNIEAWKHHLYDYKDQVIIQYLQYGFPLSITSPDSLRELTVKNHFSAMQHKQAIASYLTKEKHHGAIVGPIPNLDKHFIHCSPLLTRPKDNGKRRVILDLSYPSGLSLNDHTDKDLFDASPFSLRFPSVDTIANKIVKHGDDVTLAKIDIERCNGEEFG